MKSVMKALCAKAILFLMTTSAAAVTTNTQAFNYFTDANGNVGFVYVTRKFDPTTNVTTTNLSYSFCVQTTAASCLEGSGVIPNDAFTGHLTADIRRADVLKLNADTTIAGFVNQLCNAPDPFSLTGMEMMFPGSAALMKRNRAVVGEAITGVRSRTRLEQYDVNQLQQCVGILMALEHRLKAEPAASEENLLAQVAMAKEDFRGKPQLTLLEARLRESVEQVGKATAPARKKRQSLSRRSHGEYVSVPNLVPFL